MPHRHREQQKQNRKQKQQQQQQQQQPDAVDAASKLQELLLTPRLSQLLQQSPPAEPTADQWQLLASCSYALQDLENSLQQLQQSSSAAAAIGAEPLMSILLQRDVAHNAAALLSRTLQQPELVKASEANDTAAAVPSMTAVWFDAHKAVMALASVLYRIGKTAAPLTVDFTQQLERSGKQV
jgi:hypothetical protein